MDDKVFKKLVDSINEAILMEQRSLSVCRNCRRLSNTEELTLGRCYDCHVDREDRMRDKQ